MSQSKYVVVQRDRVGNKGGRNRKGILGVGHQRGEQEPEQRPNKEEAEHGQHRIRQYGSGKAW